MNAHKTPQQVAQRCRIVLAVARGEQDKDIAGSMGINCKTVALWRQRFLSEGPDCLWEVASGRGRKPRLAPDKVEEIINATLQTKPAAATQWSCRTMAKKAWCEQGNSQSHLAKPQSTAAPHRSFQAVPGSQVFAEIDGRRRPLSQPSRESPCALRG